jgi:hypothetical protein
MLALPYHLQDGMLHARAPTQIVSARLHWCRQQINAIRRLLERTVRRKERAVFNFNLQVMFRKIHLYISIERGGIYHQFWRYSVVIVYLCVTNRQTA